MSVKTKQKISLLIADDHPVVRKGLHLCLDRHSQLQIIGEAADGNETLGKIKQLGPDVVLMDINMPGLNGLEVTQELRRLGLSVKVLILSVHSDRDYMSKIMLAGAQGCISKNASPEELVEALELVHGGETYFPEEAPATTPVRVTPTDARADNLTQLSAREREVLALIAEGQSNKEIATLLGIGVRTIETHREHIMRRLNIRTVAGLTKYAIMNGLISLESDPRN